VADHGPLSDGSIVLAIESATAHASVALLRGAEVVARRAGDGRQHHSETLLPMVDAVLAEAGLRLDGVTACAVSIGPGSFTSLRVGLATVKGLCFASDRPTVAVPTLAALAHAAVHGGAAKGDDLVVPVLDARRGEVYAAAYRFEASTAGAWPSEVLAPRVLAADALVEALPDGGCLVGDGVPVIVAGLAGAVGRSALDVRSGARVLPDAASVGWLGRRALEAGEGVDAADLVPRYLRRAEAEVQRTASRFE